MTREKVLQFEPEKTYKDFKHHLLANALNESMKELVQALYGPGERLSTMICIKGGPITDAEQHVLGVIKKDIEKDLWNLGFKKESTKL